jgi:hypothetical protein
MGDLLGSLVWGAKIGQYCVIGGGSLHLVSSYVVSRICHASSADSLFFSGTSLSVVSIGLVKQVSTIL